jgi:hypothetical protein
MTTQEFERLPALLPRKVFMAITGLNKGDLYAMIRSGELAVFHRPWRKGRRRHGTALYYKATAREYLEGTGNGER